MDKNQIDNWRNHLNELHNEMECEVEIDWNRILVEDDGLGIVFEQKVKEREMIRRARHVVHLVESCIDNLDLMRDSIK